MDSKRKHELETNDLKDFLDNFKDFWDRNGNFILIILIVGIGGWAVLRLVGNWKTEANNEAFAALSTATDPDILMTVAADYELVHDPALLRAGDLYLDRGRQRMSRDETTKANEDLDSAEKAYQTLIDSTEDKLFLANAYLGLATVAQGRHDWDAAADALASAKEAAGDHYPAITAQVDLSEATLEELRNLIPFAPLPAPMIMPDFGNEGGGENGDETPAEFFPGPFGLPDAGGAGTEDGGAFGIENLLPGELPENPEPALPVPGLTDPAPGTDPAPAE